MAFSAMQILVFHLWIYTATASKIEIFLKQSAYIGVDIFFFISAYSLASRPVDHYLSFLWSRFKNVYFKFVIFAIIATFYLKWDLIRFVKVIFGIELFEKGGGAFLWFLPVIMIFYVWFPFFQTCDKKNRIVTLLSLCVVWVAVAFAVTKYTSYTQMFIYWNRLPVFFIGYYMYSLKDRLSNNVTKGISGVLLLMIGLLLLYKYAYISKLQTPFPDMFYLTVIPVAMGLVLLLDFIPAVKPIQLVGNATLEIYAVQMIFGYNIANKLLLTTNNIMLTNICTIVIVLTISVIFQMFFKCLLNQKALIRSD